MSASHPSTRLDRIKALSLLLVTVLSSYLALGVRGASAAEVAVAEASPSAPTEPPPPAFVPPLSPEEEAFFKDFSVLTLRPHRLAGSSEGQQAAEFVEQKLKAIGLTEVLTQDMAVWQARTESAYLQIEGRQVKLYPMRPNITILPNTGPEGLSGPVLYAGQGRPEDYQGRSPVGAIVVVDYDSYDAWRTALALGAKAVVFLERGKAPSNEPKWSGVPGNQLRFYAPVASQVTVDLTRDYPAGKLHSKVLWESVRGRNILARIRGTDATFAHTRTEREALVLAAPLDSFGEVPEMSPGARGAANVAGLLAAAKWLYAHPPKRDVILLFVDNQAREHQGAREFYEVLTMPEDLHKSLTAAHAAETRFISAMTELLQKDGLIAISAQEGDRRVLSGLSNALVREANFARDDVRKLAELARLRVSSSKDPAAIASSRAQATEHTELSLRWDEIRRALHKHLLTTFVGDKTRLAQGQGSAADQARLYLPLFDRLRDGTVARFVRRASELGRLGTFDSQREVIRRTLAESTAKDRKMPWIVLHASYDLSDQGSTFGAVVGDFTNRLFPWRTPRSDADTPGYYGRVLNALSEASKNLTGISHLDRVTLSDPNVGMTFSPGYFFSSGNVAGAYGYYNVAFMTGYDRRSRDGYPTDTAAALDFRALQKLSRETTTLLEAAANSAELSLPSVFKSLTKSKYPTFDQGQNSGDYVGLQVSGSLKEDRPAEGAVLAIWPGNTQWKNQAFSSLEKALEPPQFDPIVLETVEQTGRFRTIGLREDMHSEIMTLGSVYDSGGLPIAITTQEKQAQKLTDAMRVNLFFGKGFSWTAMSGLQTQPQLLKVLNASSDSPFRVNRSLFGQLEDHGFAYISDQVVGYRLKLFQPMGVTVLGQATAGHIYGSGLSPDTFSSGVDFVRTTAEELHQLNERRLGQLRARGVTSADLELLHSRSKREIDRGLEASLVSERHSSFLRSASLSHHVYLPLREAMDDLVHSIVLLLLLAIPFAFALERLTICATTIYGRIGGFTTAFLITFGLLYWLHPGFAIAATPAIIFLAFAIVLLSSLVIFIVVRKFKAELKAMQGQAKGLHSVEVSTMGTMLAAVGMGMSTMRRRRMRTTLTAVTVVMLTFTILSFASFSRTVGVRASYEGPAGEHTTAKVLLHKLDFSEIEPNTLMLLEGKEGKEGLISPQYWLIRELNAPERISVATATSTKNLEVDAIMGLSAGELKRWPELLAGLGKGSADVLAAIERGEVFLPAIMQQVLGLQIGDSFSLNGKSVKFAGALDSAILERLRHLDGHPVLPVNFQDAAAVATASNSGGGQKDETQLILADEVDRNFTHLSSDQVAIGSPALVRQLGGKLHSIAIYTPDSVDASALGRRIAELVVMPVWAAGTDGVERLVFTVLTQVAGGFGLFVPLLLGGLIIFGTLLGSIGDREREIYTFSALGLAPGHVGALFFAEAAVYAVIGGMGGQLLAQFVGQGAAMLARAGVIKPVSINYSSTNSLFAIGVVMLTVLVSAVYPALRASKSANPGLARSWQMPAPVGDKLDLVFPFTVSAYDIVGIMSYLAEHFRHHADAGLGEFASTSVEVRRNETGNLELVSDVALAPFDLGVTQTLSLAACPSEIPGVDEVRIHILRLSGTHGDFTRANKTFLKNLRKQFLLWRTLSHDLIETYRRRTYEELQSSSLATADAPSAAEGANLS